MTERHNNRRWDLTEDRMSHLNACTAQGLSLHSAATELGVLANTIKAAALREHKTEWLRGKFPRAFAPNQKGRRIKDFEGPRARTIEDLGGWPEPPNNVVTQWLTHSWR